MTEEARKLTTSEKELIRKYLWALWEQKAAPGQYSFLSDIHQAVFALMRWDADQTGKGLYYQVCEVIDDSLRRRKKPPVHVNGSSAVVRGILLNGAAEADLQRRRDKSKAKRRRQSVED